MKKMLNIVIILMIIFSTGNIFAVNMPTNPGYNPNNVVSTDITNAANSFVATFITLVQVACVATLVVMGLRYMFASADGKADIKKGITVWCVGASIVFSATTLIGIVLGVVTGGSHTSVSGGSGAGSGTGSSIGTGTGSGSGADSSTSTSEHWATAAWNAAIEAGIMPDSIKNNLGKNLKISRIEFFEVIYKSAGYQGVSLTPASGKTYDVDSGVKDIVNKLYGAGIIKGTKPETSTGQVTISPNSNITREDLATTLYRYMGIAGKDLSKFSTTACSATDVDSISDYAKAAMIYMYNAKIIQGYNDSTIKPKGYTTCEEAITMVNRILGLKTEN